MKPKLNMQYRPPKKIEIEPKATLYVRGVSPETIDIFRREAAKLGLKGNKNSMGLFFDHLAKAIKSGKKTA